jgi:hypothetical protein
MSQSIPKNPILNVMDTFARAYSINKDLNISDETPLRDILPGVWPTFGELRELYIVASLMGWTTNYTKE